MLQKSKVDLIKIARLALLLTGVCLLAVSTLYTSSFLAIIGLSILFWSIILFYIKPVKHVPLTLLTAVAETNTSNIERILIELDLTEKGVYLPPKNLQNLETSLIFIPKTSKATLPLPQETAEKLYTQQQNGILLTPPGLALANLFQQELNNQFTRLSLTELPNILSKLLVQKLEIVQDAEAEIQGNTINIILANSLLSDLCVNASKQPRTHLQVGCILSSAIACVLAQVTGKPIIIQNETQTPETKTTTITYQMQEA